VKLDRNFINGISKSPQDVELVQSLVQLGKTLNLLIVASGIEDNRSATAPRGQGDSLRPGLLFSAPREAEQIDQFLEDFAIFSGRPL